MRNVILWAAVTMLSTTAARSAELTILSAAAMRGALNPIVAGYQGAQVSVTYGTAGAMQAALDGGAKPDIIILPPPRLRVLIKGGLAGGEIMPIAAVRLSLAVKTGAPKPDISSVEKVRAAVFAAPSLAFASPGKGAAPRVFFDRMLKEKGWYDALRPRMKLYEDGSQAAEAVASGAAMLMAGQTSEIVETKGIELVAALPEAIQLVTVYAGAVGSGSRDPAAAASLLRYLAAPERAGQLTPYGLEVPQ